MKNKILTSVAIASFLFIQTATANNTDITNELKQPVSVEQTKEFNLKHHPKHNFQKISQKLSQELNLTEEQQEQAKKIRQDGHEKIKPLLKQMKEIRKQMDELRKENMVEFEKILTPKQLEKFNKIKEEGRKSHNKKRPFLKKHDN